MGAWLSSPDKISHISHRSVHSTNPTFIVFHNASSEYVRICWIDYSGRKRIYSIIKPGDIHIQATFQTHPWTFDRLTHTPGPGGEMPAFKIGTLAADFRTANLVDLVSQQQVVYPSSGTVAKRVTIIDSPPVPWCIYSHAEFIGEYKNTVKEVMLCYSRLLKLRGATPRAHLGDLPMGVLLKILAEASPEVFCEPTKPPLPDGTTPLDYTYKELLLLFEGPIP